MADILLVLATAAEAAEETSHMPFYIMGGVLALWATVIAFFGISKRTTYPAGDGGRNLVVLVTLVLVVGTCTSAVLTG